MKKKAEFTAEGFGKELGVSGQVVRYWLRNGLIRGAYIDQTVRGPVWMIPAASLKTFVRPKMGRPPQKRGKGNESSRPTGRREITNPQSSSTSAEKKEGRQMR